MTNDTTLTTRPARLGAVISALLQAAVLLVGLPPRCSCAASDGHSRTTSRNGSKFSAPTNSATYQTDSSSEHSPVPGGSAGP